MIVSYDNQTNFPSHEIQAALLEFLKQDEKNFEQLSESVPVRFYGSFHYGGNTLIYSSSMYYDRYSKGGNKLTITIAYAIENYFKNE